MRAYKVAALHYASRVWTHIAYICLLGKERKKQKGGGGDKGGKMGEGGAGGRGVGSGFRPAPFWVTCLYRF